MFNLWENFFNKTLFEITLTGQTGQRFHRLMWCSIHSARKMHYHEEHCFELNQKKLKKQKQLRERIKMEKNAKQKEEREKNRASGKGKK